MKKKMENTIERSKEHIQMVTVTTNKDLKCNLEAEEGGWGYVVCAVFGMVMILEFGTMTSLPLLFNDYLTFLTGSEVGVFKLITMANSYLMIFGGIGSFSFNLLVKLFTIRKICFMCAALILSGDILLLNMTTQMEFIAAHALIKGFALGILFSACFVVLSSYFVRRRTSMASIAGICPCISGMVFPHLVVTLMNNYGFRGTMKLLLAFDLHSICAAFAMIISRRSTKMKSGTGKSLNCEFQEISPTQENIGKIGSVEKRNSKTYYFNDKKRSESFIRKTISKIVYFLDFNLLGSPIFSNVVIGSALASTMETLYLTSTPIIFLSMFTENQTAHILSVASGVEIVSKILIAVLNYYFRINNRLMFYISICSSSVIRTVMIQSKNYYNNMICNALISVFRPLYQVTYLLVVTDRVTEDKYPAAIALFHVFQITFLYLGSNCAGLIRERSEGYTALIYAINLVNVTFLLMWTIEFCITRKIFRNR